MVSHGMAWYECNVLALFVLSPVVFHGSVMEHTKEATRKSRNSTYKKGQQLLLHQINFSHRKDLGVGRPVLVLGRLVIEVLGSDDQGCQEYSMAGAVHAYKKRERIT